MDLEELARRLRALPIEPDAIAGDARRAAVALVLRLREGSAEVLLMRRAERAGDRWSGQIGLPGGKADPIDPDLRATAVREAHEEVGLDLERDTHLVGCLQPVQAKARGALLPMWITPFVFRTNAELELHLGPEASEAFWFPLTRARAGELAWTYRYMRGNEERILPAWRDGQRVVWGLTYEILAGFLRVAP